MRNLIKWNLRNIRMDESNKEHALKKQLDSLRQDILENNKVINHLFEEYKSLSSLLQATVSPWLPQNSHNENSDWF